VPGDDANLDTAKECMAHFRHRRFRRHHHDAPRIEPQEISDPAKQARATVTVVLITGEELKGRIRYYDRDCFSIGPAAGGPKIFLRKSSVRCIVEA
jgi:hypothetical protein